MQGNSQELDDLICDWAWYVIMSTQIFTTFLRFKFLFYCCMAMRFSQSVYNLSGFVVQATEWKYSIPIIRYDS